MVTVTDRVIIGTVLQVDIKAVLTGEREAKDWSQPNYVCVQ